MLEGEEPYHIDKISDFIEKNVLNDSEKSFNQFVVYGKDTSVEKLLGACKQAPMMGNRTVVILREAQMMQELVKVKEENAEDKKGKEKTVTSADRLENYFLNPNPSTLLCICFKDKKVDRRNKLGKALDKNAVVLTTKKLYDDKIPEWIMDKAHETNLKISIKSAAMLFEFIGNDLNRLENEMQKLTINLTKAGEITSDDIERNIGISKDYNEFELNKALGSKDTLKAFRIVNHFSHNEKEYPLVKTLGTLHRFFWQLYVYHSVKQQGDKEAAAAIGINPFFLRDTKTASVNFPPLKCEQILAQLHTYDLRSKGMNNGETTQGELLKELVYKILN